MQVQALTMANTIHHRGPNDGGTWVDASSGLALASRRLAIIDLSEDGHQPMTSGSGRYVVAFNGEIYNFRELRRELDVPGAATPSDFRGNSDTEVLLAAVDRWGLESTLDRVVGMYAFALWDQQQRKLHLVRDRLGEKPLYYGWMGETLLFGSELKAIRSHPVFTGQIDRDAVAVYLQRGYIPAPLSIYKGIAKLPPGTVLTVHADGAAGASMPKAYWSPKSVVEAAQAEPFSGTDQEAREHLDALLRQSVRQQMIADVPLGACLSGGVDSSVVVALMQAETSVPVKTFTIGFDEPGYNEAEHAKAVAHHVGTDHTELYVTPAEARVVIPQLPTLYDEPFADPSQIPTYLVYQLMRQHVTVGLSGDGGDELFAGYRRYGTARHLWRRTGWVPRQLRRVVGDGLRSVSADLWAGAFDVFRLGTPSGRTGDDFGRHVHLFGKLVGISSREAMYNYLTSIHKDPLTVVRDAEMLKTGLVDSSMWPSGLDFTHHMMFVDLITYLPDDILVKVDRASMGVSLEARVPFLDHRVVEFAWQLPLGMKVRNGREKWLLRQVLDTYVPRELVERPKTGFGVPIGEWLRGPLREWAEALLDEDLLRNGNLIDAALVRAMWTDHLSGQTGLEYQLWTVLMLQAWIMETGISDIPRMTCSPARAA